MKDENSLVASHINNMIAEAAHAEARQREKDMYEEVIETEDGLTIIGMNYNKNKIDFNEVLRRVR